MEEARKLMDSLMGGSRNQALDEAKKTKGKNFIKDDICKAYLLGFCPLSELGDSKMAVKRRIKRCDKSHSDAAKEELEAHPDKAKYIAEYERKLLPVLEGLAKEADFWVKRESGNVEAVAGKTEKVTQNTMSPEQLESYENMKADLSKMMAAAEAEADKGNFDGSKFKVMLADEIKEKVKELEDIHISTFDVTHRGEDVCEICGTKYEALNATNHARHKAHFQGKVHLSYEKVRDWIKRIKGDETGIEKISRGDDDREGSSKRDRRRSRSRRQGGGDRRERSQERDQRRSRSRGDKGRDRGRERGYRSRSRGDRRNDRRDDRRGRGRD